MENNPPSPATSESSTATRVFGTRISDRDLTEIELHSVESINDLHRTHPEPNHKGSRRPPLPPAPSTNGNLHPRDRPFISQTGRPIKRRWQNTLRDLLTPKSCRHTWAVAVTALMLLTILFICFLVRQGSALQSLSEAVRTGEQAVALRISELIQELKILRNNLTAITEGSRSGQ
ncbi:uncharacterized protein si:dkey-20d21.12 isoform X1 [Esox lucius]|uniref:uncharacterized protein si:dkey-20d21.12 isoform X1 n=1 Tax=Esox lucius TaxID=8010 RepID=UPI001477678F|nr:uncharacterized protein si:dkey-20d21.12 isoform X1 [Esox lucius]XP_034152003.1 uncharacterized protein si:dkey-20d21.12 isoform X1 [Esox lucius]XP_034152004.1 uncharacterized protein si:dkey-20d21.12 isoform X1 [Esox lucius]